LKQLISKQQNIYKNRGHKYTKSDGSMNRNLFKNYSFINNSTVEPGIDNNQVKLKIGVVNNN